MKKNVKLVYDNLFPDDIGISTDIGENLSDQTNDCEDYHSPQINNLCNINRRILRS